jgi:hypothetical protein
MKLLIENWRKYLNEAVNPGEAAMIAREVLQKIKNKEPFYPYPEKEVLGDNTLEAFLNREAAQSRGRASEVFKSVRFFQGGYSDDEGRIKNELDALQVLLQLALKGRTYKKHKEDLEASRIRYGYKDSEGQQISGESDDTQVFIPKESIIRENQNLSEKEKTVLKAEALFAFMSNMADPNMAKQAEHKPMRPADIKKLSVEDPEKLKNYIKTHNHMIDNSVLFNFIRSM